MNFSAHQHNFGFTLIEMVVVVGIMGILLVIGVASYGRMNDRAKVEQAAITVATQIRTWQKQAESGIGSGECAGVFGGLSVSNVGNQVVKALVICDGDLIEADNRVFDMSKSCKECEIVDPFSFTLRPLGLGITPETDITIDNPRIDGLAYIVSLSPSGGIDVQKKSP